VSGDKDATRAAVNDDARNSSRRSPPDMLGLTPHGEALPEREQHRKQRPRREREHGHGGPGGASSMPWAPTAPHCLRPPGQLLATPLSEACRRRCPTRAPPPDAATSSKSNISERRVGREGDDRKEGDI
jgi:hypothetical protein